MDELGKDTEGRVGKVGAVRGFVKESTFANSLAEADKWC